eukprot:TRINITY_DN17333_c0_g1_i1.p1 TRINITY_DN17333_c0_g1~~TRINITY_DN17333_c0_g1_i1.p1  ORF type:complete len:788 (+),score=168.81 TRINITY_DN17333_c0_g1_i1:19-2382(+)
MDPENGRTANLISVFETKSEEGKHNIPPPSSSNSQDDSYRMNPGYSIHPLESQTVTNNQNEEYRSNPGYNTTQKSEDTQTTQKDSEKLSVSPRTNETSPTKQRSQSPRIQQGIEKFEGHLVDQFLPNKLSPRQNEVGTSPGRQRPPSPRIQKHVEIFDPPKSPRRVDPSPKEEERLDSKDTELPQFKIDMASVRLQRKNQEALQTDDKKGEEPYTEVKGTNENPSGQHQTTEKKEDQNAALLPNSGKGTSQPNSPRVDVPKLDTAKLQVNNEQEVRPESPVRQQIQNFNGLAPEGPPIKAPSPVASPLASPRRSPLSSPRGDGDGDGDCKKSLFDQFTLADDILSTLAVYEQMKKEMEDYEKSELKDLGSVPYQKMKAFYYNCRPNLWATLDRKVGEEVYKETPCSHLTTLVVGAGPAGLRFAIEAALLGSRVTVIEKRNHFTRNNVLHVWKSSISDLVSLGAKTIAPRFCTGAIDHVEIKKLQLVLLKIALIVGVEMRTLTELKEIGVPVKLTSEGKDEDFPCDVLVGADGEHSVVTEKAAFDTKTFRAGFAIGITANFVNTFTSDELKLEEFGLISYARKDFFEDLQKNFQITLENLVYYRENTHYFVMTATKQSLLARGVLKSDQETLAALLLDSNIDREKLCDYVRDIANSVGLPSTCEFATDHHQMADTAIFDFTKKASCTSPAKILNFGDKKLLVSVIGDALVAPFWPLGTGANRAILSALDTAFLLTKFNPGVDLDQLMKQQLDIFKLMENSAPETLVDQYSKWTIDPNTRYKKHVVLLG